MLILKFLWNFKEHNIVKTILKKEQSPRTHISWLQNLMWSYRNRSKRTCYWLKDVSVDHWNRFLCPEINPYIWSTDFNKHVKTIQWGKSSLLNNWYWDDSMHMHTHTQSRPHLTQCAKMNSRWIKSPNRRTKIIIFLQRKIYGYFHEFRFGSRFLDIPSKNFTSN